MQTSSLLKISFSNLAIFTTLFFFSQNISLSQGQGWAYSFNSPGNYVKPSNLTKDNDGYLYSTGYFKGSIQLGSTTLTSSGDADIFIIKYNQDGSVVWAKKAGGLLEDVGSDIALDGYGNLFLIGHFDGTTNFEGNLLTSYGQKDIFIAKYSTDGIFQWVVQAGGSSWDYSVSISCDNNGNAYLAGDFTAPATFGNLVVNDGKSYVAKYDPFGQCEWVTTANSSFYPSFRNIKADGEGNIYLSGQFAPDITISGQTFTASSNDGNGFIAKLNNTGVLQWLNYYDSGIYANRITDLELDSENNIVFTGEFGGWINIGGIPLTGNGYLDVFIGKCNSLGNIIWARSINGIDCERYQLVTIDNDNNIFATIRTSVCTGTDSISVNNIKFFTKNDVLVIKLNGDDGTIFWVNKNYGEGQSVPYGIVATDDQSCVITGYFYGTKTFGNASFSPSSPGGLYLWKIESFVATLEPTGNEKFIIGDPFQIVWQNTPNIQNVNIEFSTDNGTNWVTIASGLNSTNYHYEWTIPDLPTLAGKIKITDANNPLNYSINDGAFVIPKISLNHPNGGEALGIGSIKQITWSKFGVNFCKIEYTTDAGISWNLITTTTSLGTVSYDWTVPNTPSSQCKIRISDRDDSRVFDVSENNFSIVTPSLSLTSPNGGESWRSGSIDTITWSSIAVEAVKIQYSINNGITLITLAENIPASNLEYHFVVPYNPSSNCRVKISDVSNSSRLDVSNSIFSIVNPTPQYSGSYSPVVGISSTTTLGNSQITFIGDVINTGNLNVLFFNVYPKYSQLPSGVDTISYYYWDIQNSGVLFENGTLSIPISFLNGVTDPTKLIWLKRTTSADLWQSIGGVLSDGKLVSTIPFNSFSQFAIGSSGNSNPLPVELKSFTARVVNSEIKLHWVTETEINNYGFNIERKINELEWVTIGFVLGNGNSNSPKEYTYNDQNPSGFGTFLYRLKQIDNDGSHTFSPEIKIQYSVINEYKLSTCYPNPFNPSTTISYQIPKQSYVTLKIFDILGNELQTLTNEEQAAGKYEILFNAENLSNGIYFYRLQVDEFTETKKMILLK